MTAQDTADKMFGDLITAGANAFTNFASVLVDGCGLSRAGADMQGFGDVLGGGRANHFFTSV